MKESFCNIEQNDIVIVLLTEKNISQGMLLEIGYAKACKKTVVVFCLNNLKQYFATTLSIVDRVHSYESQKDSSSNLL